MSDVDEVTPRGKVPIPEHISLEERPGGLRIVRRWFSPRIIFLAFFCIFWDGFLVFWYTRPEMPLFAMLFSLMHVAIGIGLTYSTLAGFINSTVIDIGSGQLVIRHRPLPWFGNRTLARGELKQLFSEEVRGSGQSRFTFRLSAVHRDGRKIKLVGGLPEADQALFLEQQIESRLGIADQRVGGELPR